MTMRHKKKAAAKAPAKLAAKSAAKPARLKRSSPEGADNPQSAAATRVADTSRPCIESDVPDAAPAASDHKPTNTFSIVGIGASAGGLDAFLQLLEHLPTDANLAIIFVQHLLADRKSELAHVLAGQTPWPVVEATHGSKVEPRHIYVIPPNVTLEIAEGRLALTPRATDPGHHHLPVDYLFRSLAQFAQEKAIGVVLSGTGSDGSMGVREIRAVGGIAIAQLPDSAQYDGMPRAAIATDGVDLVLPPPQIGVELARLASHGFARHVSPEREGDALSVEEEQLRRVFAILRAANGVDFKHYKTPTIRRRLQRRMTLQKIQKIGDYIHFLEQHPAEVHNLYRDLLIHVTRFFREPESFETLKQIVFPKVLNNRKDDEAIRIWVPGCSTGEEPYSVAISLLEFLGDRQSNIPIQIFGTDLSEAAVSHARAGMYSDNITDDLSPERIRRFFVQPDGGQQITKAIRDLCIFARQDVTRDPPFSKLDLIVCRNVLIYLNAQIQKKLMPIFHYALKPSGFMMLGAAETIGSHSDLFHAADKKHRVYMKISTHVAAPISFPVDYPHRSRIERERQTAPETHLAMSIQEANRTLMERFAPPGVIVDGQSQIVYFQGQTGKYLAPAPGGASLNLLKMAREGILYGLRTAIRDARKTGRATRRAGLKMRRNGDELEVNVEVVPLGAVEENRHCLVLFEDAETTREPPALSGRPPGTREPPGTGEPPGSSRRSTGKAKSKPRDAREIETRVEILEQELAATRDYLQSIIQDLEAANEELQSANEEILSSNEELQSTNEELDTAKEELQSTNEELNTVNEELHHGNEELTQINSDLVNVLSSVQIAIVIVSNDLRIRRFTPMAEKLLNLIPGDVGRPIGQVRPGFSCPDLEQMITQALESVAPVARDVQDPSGRWFSLNVRPYKTIDNRIDGAIVGLFDVDTQKREGT
jgi:two-component system CheB/CheR fusion protein